MGIRAWGPSAAAVFEQAALGMLALMYDTAAVAPSEPVAIELEAPDGELLLAAWLNELLYLVEARRTVFGRLEVAAVGPIDANATRESRPLGGRGAGPAQTGPEVTFEGASPAERGVGRAVRNASGTGAPSSAPSSAEELVRLPWRLQAAGVGEAVDARRHTVRHVVKAATLHGLSLRRTANGWEGRVLLDV